MTVVVGTAGHIDHGKTALLRALTGIDADRLPEERRRGMTIDVGYAWLTLPDGEALDFVDVPGHDRLVGNMLVGAGEIDAAMLVVAADDGPRAQTLEHLELLDALGIADGLAVVTKLDLLGPDDPRRTERVAEVGSLLAGTSLAGAPVVAVSALSGEGLGELRAVLAALRLRILARPDSAAARLEGGARLAIDRVFTIRGRGAVVTGTLRGGRLERGESVRVVPALDGALTARARELQVHGGTVEAVAGSGRVALNLAGVAREGLQRGMVVGSSVAVVSSDRVLVALRTVPGGRPLRNGAEVRLHLGTDEAVGRVRLAGAPGASEPELLGILRLARPIAVALDDRFVLRWPSPATTAAGGRVLDPLPPRQLARRRLDAAALAPLAEGGTPGRRLAALLAAHGALADAALLAYSAALGTHGTTTEAYGAANGASGGAGVRAGPLLLDPALALSLERQVLDAVAAHHDRHPSEAGLPRVRLRPQLAQALRRAAAVTPAEAAAAADALLDALVTSGRLARNGDRLRDPARQTALPPGLAASMARLEAALDTAAPPPLTKAAQAAGCPEEGVRLLASEGRIVRVGPDLAYAASAYTRLEALALRLAAAGPLTPAAFRDASGTSRKYALAILEEIDGRGLLRRGPDGHRLGPKAPRG